NSPDRARLLQEIATKQVYAPDYSKVKRSYEHGRRLYTYNVSIKPDAYVSMLQTYTKDIGLTSVAGLDPAAYANSAAITLQLSVDVFSRQLVRISYPNQSAQSERVEEYSGYGGSYRIALPTKTISLSELQNRVQAIQ
ncbi:MAG: hypothetical protein JWS12_93, partial [Candidatus Saccharibacteria bacterium]|nr:hypothetical protein [Candidatus Saccharibacteria bacterium]